MRRVVTLYDNDGDPVSVDSYSGGSFVTLITALESSGEEASEFPLHPDTALALADALTDAWRDTQTTEARR